MTQCVDREKLNIKLSNFLIFGLRGISNISVGYKQNVQSFYFHLRYHQFSFPKDGQSAFCCFDVGRCLVFMSTAQCRTPGATWYAVLLLAWSRPRTINTILWLPAISNETFLAPRRVEVVKLNDDAFSAPLAKNNIKLHRFCIQPERKCQY